MDLSSIPETLIVNHIEPYTRREIPIELSNEINEINREAIWDELVDEIKNMKYAGYLQNENDVKIASEIYESNGKYGAFSKYNYVPDENGLANLSDYGHLCHILLGIYNDNPFPIKYTISFKYSNIKMRTIEMKSGEKRWILENNFFPLLCTQQNFNVHVEPINANFKIYRGILKNDDFIKRLRKFSFSIPLEYSQLGLETQEEHRKDKNKNFFLFFNSQFSYIGLFSSTSKRYLWNRIRGNKKRYPITHEPKALEDFFNSQITNHDDIL